MIYLWCINSTLKSAGTASTYSIILSTIESFQSKHTLNTHNKIIINILNIHRIMSQKTMFDNFA